VVYNDACVQKNFKLVFVSYTVYGDYSTRLHLPPLRFTVSDDAGIEPMIVATLSLTARRLIYSAIAHPHSAELFLVEIFELM
jgi:hypothetical protein